MSNDNVDSNNEESKMDMNNIPRFDIPIVITDDSADDAMYTELKNQMVKTIISNRLIKKEEIDRFIDEVKQSNHVNYLKYMEIVQQVKHEIGDVDSQTELQVNQEQEEQPQEEQPQEEGDDKYSDDGFE